MHAEAKLTTHALERYRIYYPSATEIDLRKALSEGFEIDPRSAHAITGRNARGLPLRKGTIYIMNQDRTGLFTVDKRDKVIVTFLRFNHLQEEKVLRLWPVTEETPAPVPSVIKTTAPEPVDYRTFLPDPNPGGTARHLAEDKPSKPGKSRWVKDQEKMMTALPHVGMPSKYVRVSRALADLFSQTERKPIAAARCALVEAQDQITPLTSDLCVVDIEIDGDTHTLYLFRRRDFERGEPEWWLCKDLPPELPEVEVKMAMMLIRRGWNCFPPIPE